MERDEQADRCTIEFRAGLAIGAAVALAATSPLLALASKADAADGWAGPAVAIPAFTALIATFGLTGWWIDAIRSWWGQPRWFRRQDEFAASA